MDNHSIYESILAVFFLISTTTLFAQQHHCAFDQVHQEMLLTDSVYHKKQASLSKKINQYLLTNQLNDKTDETILIPVVVHVVYADKDADHNISDAQIESAIRRLNDIFSDTDNASIDTKIKFQLARKTPDCQPTDGIVRVDGSGIADYATEGIDIEANDTDGKGASRIGIFNLSRWNTEEYLNIWVVNEISDNNAGAGIQAFATFPETHHNYDGVVVLYNAFGYDYDNCLCFELKLYTDENEIVAHEIGHYFGLYHTFEGDNGGASCPSTVATEGDQVEDTPAHIRTFQCSSAANTCYNAANQFANMDAVVHNFMSYTPESCQYEFTQGQVDRMRAVLLNYRPGLINSSGLEEVDISESLTVCQPQSTQGTTGEYGMGIIYLEIGDLKSASGSTFQDGGYLNNWCNYGTFETNTPYSIQINTYGYYNEDLKVFLDYNGNGEFGSDELIFSSSNKSIHAGTFTTPENVEFDTPLKIRIISDHYQYNITNGCYAPTYGQVEDYTVIFHSPTPAPEIERGFSLKFDGIDDYIETGFAPDPVNQEFTYEFWCKPEGDSSQFQIIFDRTPSNFSTYSFMSMWYGRIFIYMDKELLFMNSAPLKMNNWYHIAYTWDGIYQRLYVNGILTGEHKMEVIKENLSPLKFGAFLDNYLFFNGQIDELRTWNYARKGEQIRQHMHMTNSIVDETEIIYYHFNDSISNNTILDYKNNYNINLFGQPSTILSTANTGTNGIYTSIENVNSLTDTATTSVGINLSFSQSSTDLPIYITQQNYAANSYTGLDNTTPFKERTWTINSSVAEGFSTAAKFIFPENTFSDLNAANYKLYHRGVGSDGNWQLLIEGASEITSQTVTFDGINKIGQFIITK